MVLVEAVSRWLNDTTCHHVIAFVASSSGRKSTEHKVIPILTRVLRLRIRVHLLCIRP